MLFSWQWLLYSIFASSRMLNKKYLEMNTTEEIWKLTSCSGNEAGFQGILPATLATLEKNSFLSSFCTILYDHFVLIYEINCNLWKLWNNFIVEVETLNIYWGLFTVYCINTVYSINTVYCREKKTTKLVFIAEKLQCVLRHSDWKPHGKKSEGKCWRKMGKTESQHWHNAPWKRMRCRQPRHMIGWAWSVMRGNQSSYGPGHLLIQCRLSDNMPHQLATNISWVMSMQAQKISQQVLKLLRPIPHTPRPVHFRNALSLKTVRQLLQTCLETVGRTGFCF